MAKILIPTPLRPYTDKQDSVDAAGATVGELLADLTRRHAGLKAHLYNEQGKLRSFVNVYINDEDIRYLQKEQTPVNAGDTVSIIPSVAGGVETVAPPSPSAAIPAWSRSFPCRIQLKKGLGAAFWCGRPTIARRNGAQRSVAASCWDFIIRTRIIRHGRRSTTWIMRGRRSRMSLFRS